MAISTLPRHVLHVTFAVLTAVNRGLWSYGMCGASLGTWFPNSALIFKSHVAHEECLCKCRQCASLIWWEPLTRSRSIQLRILETNFGLYSQLDMLYILVLLRSRNENKIYSIPLYYTDHCIVSTAI